MAQETLSPPAANEMRPVQQAAPAYDSIVPILERFSCLPADCLEQMFSDFAAVAKDHDLRGLLDAISDWAATAEVYADPALSADLAKAINGRKGVKDWLPGS